MPPQSPIPETRRSSAVRDLSSRRLGKDGSWPRPQVGGL